MVRFFLLVGDAARGRFCSPQQALSLDDSFLRQHPYRVSIRQATQFRYLSLLQSVLDWPTLKLPCGGASRSRSPFRGNALGPRLLLMTTSTSFPRPASGFPAAAFSVPPVRSTTEVPDPRPATHDPHYSCESTTAVHLPSYRNSQPCTQAQDGPGLRGIQVRFPVLIMLPLLPADIYPLFSNIQGDEHVLVVLASKTWEIRMSKV